MIWTSVLSPLSMKPSMKYIDKYPGCVGCPHLSYCGKMVGSLRLCNSYDRDQELSKEEKLPSVMGQMVYRAQINYDLWKCILDYATDSANDGYPGLVEYLDEPVNCQCTLIEGTPWCEIELGANSFREEEWCAIHRIISLINWHYENVASVDVQYQSFEGLQPSSSYMADKPFTSLKEQEEYIMSVLDCITPEQAFRNLCTVIPLKSQDVFEKKNETAKEEEPED